MISNKKLFQHNRHLIMQIFYDVIFKVGDHLFFLTTLLWYINIFSFFFQFYLLFKRIGIFFYVLKDEMLKMFLVGKKKGR